MENLVIKGIITATSKKQDGEFQQEIPTKTGYISTDSENAKLLEDFGMRKYTSKKGDDYFISKFPKEVMVYKPNGFGTKRPDLSKITVVNNDGVETETNNFKTTDDKMVMLNIIKGNHKNNDFFRIQAIRVEDDSEIEEIEPENPFGDEQAF